MLKDNLYYQNTYYIFIIIGLSLLGDSMLYTVLPAQIEVMPISISQMGIILSINRFIRLFSNYWAAEIYKIYGQKHPFHFSVFLSILITFGYGLSQSFFYLFILRILWGFCYSFLRLKGLLVIFKNENKNSGKLTGKYRAMTRIGSIIGALFGGFLADIFSFQTTTIIFGFISSISLFLIYKIKRMSINRNTNKNYFIDKNNHIGQINKIKNIFKDIKFLSLILIGFSLYFLIQGLIKSSYGIYLSQIFRSSINLFGFSLGIATLNGFILSSKSFIELFFSPFFGSIADKFSKTFLLFITFLSQGILLIILGLVSSKYFALFIPFILFINSALIIIIVYVQIGNYRKFSISDRMANFTTASDLGSAFGPFSLLLFNFGLNLQVMYIIFGSIIIVIAINYIYNWS